MDRIQRPLTTLGILVVYFESLIWFLRGIDDKVQAAKDSNSRVFETYVSATFVVMIYFSICLASQSLISGFIIASLVSFLVWLSVAFTIPVRNPFEVSSLLSFYGFVSVTALLQLRNQEFRYRRIFQLEKFLANRVNIHICDVVTKPTAELTTFILDKAQIKRRGVLAKAEALDLPKSNLINFSSSWNNNFARATDLHQHSAIGCFR
ncbi:hypothetical protein BC829DRAFT_183336 [Chytridium lagenaria]|nr:hypothetical protein BC829DRAFT_183336 [Chytridium lagenaria]